MVLSYVIYQKNIGDIISLDIILPILMRVHLNQSVLTTFFYIKFFFLDYFVFQFFFRFISIIYFYCYIFIFVTNLVIVVSLFGFYDI